ncbi:MAG: serine hydrolase [Myxococcaceae bacterium]|nr:serine hydrolase [Myxococcaceae bacterium]
MELLSVRSVGFVAWVASTLVATAARAACPERTVWPGAAWEEAADRMDPEALAAFEDYTFTLQGKDEDRVGVRTDGVVIIQGGKKIYERYARGFTEKNRHLTWSVSKSFTNALVGIAVREGLLSVDDSICKHLAWAEEGAPYCRVTVRHLLEMGSGFAFKEVYENESNQVSSVLAMLYGEGQRDAAKFVAHHAFRDEPGTTWMYSSGDTTLLMAVVQSALQPKYGEDFPWKLLFDPIGITSATWERDGAGTMIGSSYLYLTPRDMARFGYLMLNDGCWNGTRVEPEGWIQQSLQIDPAMERKAIDRGPTDVHGWQFWLNKPLSTDKQRPYPDVPEDAFFALGHWGQSIAIIPSKDLVIVRVADDRDGTFDLNRFLSLAMKAVKP